MFQTFISRHNSNFFSDKLVLTSVTPASRSEERFSRNAETDLVCRLLLEKKKKRRYQPSAELLVCLASGGLKLSQMCRRCSRSTSSVCGCASRVYCRLVV